MTARTYYENVKRSESGYVSYPTLREMFSTKLWHYIVSLILGLMGTVIWYMSYSSLNASMGGAFKVFAHTSGLVFLFLIAIHFLRYCIYLPAVIFFRNLVESNAKNVMIKKVVEITSLVALVAGIMVTKYYNNLGLFLIVGSQLPLIIIFRFSTIFMMFFCSVIAFSAGTTMLMHNNIFLPFAAFLGVNLLVTKLLVYILLVIEKKDVIPLYLTRMEYYKLGSWLVIAFIVFVLLSRLV